MASHLVDCGFRADGTVTGVCVETTAREGYVGDYVGGYYVVLRAAA